MSPTQDTALHVFDTGERKRRATALHFAYRGAEPRPPLPKTFPRPQLPARGHRRLHLATHRAHGLDTPPAVGETSSLFTAGWQTCTYLTTCIPLILVSHCHRQRPGVCTYFCVRLFPTLTPTLYLLFLKATMTWSKLKSKGQTPPARSGHAACVLCEKYFVVHGGLGLGPAGFTALDDIWVLNLGEAALQIVSIRVSICYTKEKFVCSIAGILFLTQTLLFVCIALLVHCTDTLTWTQPKLQVEPIAGRLDHAAVPIPGTPSGAMANAHHTSSHAHMLLPYFPLQAHLVGGRPSAATTLSPSKDGEAGASLEDVTAQFGAVLSGQAVDLDQGLIAKSAAAGVPSSAGSNAQAPSSAASAAPESSAKVAAGVTSDGRLLAEALLIYGGVDLEGNGHDDVLILPLTVDE